MYSFFFSNLQLKTVFVICKIGVRKLLIQTKMKSKVIPGQKFGMPYCSKLAFQKYTNKSSKSFISNTSSQKCARLLKAFLYSFTHTSTKYKRTCLFVSIVFYYTIIASLFAFAFRSTQKSKVIQIAGLSFESYITHVRGESFQSIINPFVKNYLSKPQIEFSFPRYAAIHSICMSENGVSIFNLFESNTYNLQLKTIKEARVRIT